MNRKELMSDNTPGLDEKPAFEETMLLDTIRAMRRDRKEHVKNHVRKSKD